MNVWPCAKHEPAISIEWHFWVYFFLFFFFSFIFSLLMVILLGIVKWTNLAIAHLVLDHAIKFVNTKKYMSPRFLAFRRLFFLNLLSLITDIYLSFFCSYLMGKMENQNTPGDGWYFLHSSKKSHHLSIGSCASYLSQDSELWTSLTEW